MYLAWIGEKAWTGLACAVVNSADVELRARIAHLVESVQDDQTRSRELFHYIWTMMCVKRGLLRVVREEDTHGGRRMVLEEPRTGRFRIVQRPENLDPDLEGLAIQALARILGSMKAAS